MVLSSGKDPFGQTRRSATFSGAGSGVRLDLHAPGRVTYLRGVHYLLVSVQAVKPDGERYRNTRDDYEWLNDRVGKAARWLRYIDFERVVDERNSEANKSPPSSNAVDANCEQVEFVGWARNHRALNSMPIHPQSKWFYPIDWPQLSAVIRFERAKGRCERCSRPHGREIRHLGDGRWWDEDERTGAMDAGALPPCSTSGRRHHYFAQPEWCWRLRTLTMIHQQPAAKSEGPMPALPYPLRP